MKKFNVVLQIYHFETYEIEAASAEEAENKVEFDDEGKLINESGKMVSTYQVREIADDKGTLAQ